MKMLLDTNVLLWALSNSPRLKQDVKNIILNSNIGTTADEVIISDISLMEISIKVNIGKLEQSMDELFDSIKQLGYRRLAISDSALRELTLLPLLHRDPFDRMIVAQAKVEKATLITGDEILAKYGIKSIII
jgi:PIN domain nuclease of toxin-antitoxin system